MSQIIQIRSSTTQTFRSTPALPTPRRCPSSRPFEQPLTRRWPHELRIGKQGKREILI
jgi:hypothetical protein